VGDPCAAGTDCTELTAAVCLPAADYSGGYCTEACDLLDYGSCPEGSACRPAAHGGTDYCEKMCRTDLDCRAGYACTSLDGAGGPVATCSPE
jgi:hypothetical protein